MSVATVHSLVMSPRTAEPGCMPWCDQAGPHGRDPDRSRADCSRFRTVAVPGHECTWTRLAAQRPGGCPCIEEGNSVMLLLDSNGVPFISLNHGDDELAEMPLDAAGEFAVAILEMISMARAAVGAHDGGQP